MITANDTLQRKLAPSLWLVLSILVLTRALDCQAKADNLTFTLKSEPGSGSFECDLETITETMTCGALSGSNSNEFSISVDGSALNKDFVLGYVYGGQLEEPGFIAAAPTVDMER